MPFEMLLFVCIWGTIYAVPCISLSFIGYRWIMRLGRYPSKTPAITRNIMFKLLVAEIISLMLILAFFKVFTSEI